MSPEIHPPSSQRFSSHDLGLIALSFVLYWGTYEFNELLDPYTTYAQGVNLLFLPAGIKLVTILVAGWRGALGCGLALLWMAATRFWIGLPLPVLIGYAALSVTTSYLTIALLLRRRRLGPVLEGLTFWDIVWIDAVNTVLHGLTINLYWWWFEQRSNEALLPSALAMALGDFLGTGVIMLLVLLVAQVLLPTRR